LEFCNAEKVLFLIYPCLCVLYYPMISIPFSQKHQRLLDMMMMTILSVYPAWFWKRFQWIITRNLQFIILR